MLSGADCLGLDGETLATRAATWRGDDCPTTQRQLADAVTARLDRVQAGIAARNRQAVAAGPGTAGWAKEVSSSASLSEDAARLQAVAAALTAAEPRPGPCMHRDITQQSPVTVSAMPRPPLSARTR